MTVENVEAPIPGKIISVKVSPGNKVTEGSEICILESMKMENPILSPVNGVVREVKVSPGQSIQAGGLIAIIDY